MEFIADERHCHTVVQGGYVAAWIDTAMARAVGVATGGEFGCNTLEIKIAYYAPALLGQTLTAEGWIERKGHIVAERYADGFSRGTALISYSMAKTVSAVLVGAAVNRGILDIRRTLDFPMWDETDPRRDITVEHLLHMTSGLRFQEVYQGLTDANHMLFSARDSAAFAAEQPLDHTPGIFWKYSTANTQLMLHALRKSFDGDDRAYRRFPREVLFDLIGMDSAVFDIDPSGTLIGGMAMYAPARDWARFGQLLLQQGKWEGKEIISKSWIDFMRTPTEANVNGRHGAHLWINGISREGRRWWPSMPDDTFAALGYMEQSLVIVPSRELVIVRLASGERRQARLEFDADVVAALR